MENVAKTAYPIRHLFILMMLLLIALLLIWRAVDLQVMKTGFLQGQGDARHLRVLQMAANRGMISDRHGEPLAISTPVDSVWVNPQELQIDQQQWRQLGSLLELNVSVLQRRLAERQGREFVYLKRHINPDVAQRIMALEINGLSLQREYRRYYPAGEVVAHVVGFTDVDDIGQEGIELAYNAWLGGTAGSKRVIKDRLGHIIENVESIREPLPGKDLTLTLDRRLQYLAYRELKAAVQHHNAHSGSLVILDVTNGEVLAMVNQPAYNPNNRSTLRYGSTRNRAVTDVFEPGSTIKPFTVAAAMNAGRVKSHTIIDTSPGQIILGNKIVRDTHNYGAIDVSTIIKKSSNVGASKLALMMPAATMWDLYAAVGFGAVTGSGFPGEVSGLLGAPEQWHEIERATLSYGYGLSVTALQLARAYAMLGAHGVKRDVAFVVTGERPAEQRILAENTARQIMTMLESVTDDDGTGTLARVAGYRIAGKTGTVQKYNEGSYSEEKYVSLFAGVAPVSKPRLAMVVMIDEPGNDEYYGGRIAAPVFGRVMAGALRMMGIAPDGLALPMKEV